jgi:signal transduction histidine kinase
MDQICADPVAFEQNVNQNMRRSGERVWIAWTNKVVKDEQGQVVEILSVGTDITQLKRAEEAVRELNTSLERRVAKRTAELAVAKDRAEEAARLKSVFLASMSHELRTPLNSIIGFTGILLQGLPGPLNPEQIKQLEMVRTSSRHLLSLINDVLDLSKVEAGQMTVARGTFSMPQSIETALKALEPLAHEKGLSFEVRVDPAVGKIVADRRKTEQILMNLGSNAIKFTGKGAVRIDCRIEGTDLVTSVTDGGIGIKAEDMGKLFEMFQQIPAGQPRSGGGTGLGLAICKKLVEIQGGKIWATSEFGVGSTFSFTLPLDAGEQ